MASGKGLRGSRDDVEEFAVPKSSTMSGVELLREAIANVKANMGNNPQHQLAVRKMETAERMLTTSTKQRRDN